MATIMELRRPMAALVIASVCGCTSLLDPNEPGVPILTIQGTVSQGFQPIVMQNPRAAVLWMRPSDSGDDKIVVESQDIALSPQFPSNLTLAIDTLPPLSMAIGLDALGYPESKITLGGLVVYDDLNANERYDLVESDASTFIDHVYGPK